MKLMSLSGIKNYCIYRLTSPSGKVYIGQTCNFKARMRKYKGKATINQQKIYRAIQKYGWDNFTKEIILENLTLEEANQKEILQIKLHNSVKEGYDIAHGGGGLLGMIRTDQTRKKMSDSRKGIKYSEETLRRMSESRKGIAAWNKGLKTNKPSWNTLTVPKTALDYKTGEIKEVLTQRFDKRANLEDYLNKGWRYWCNILYDRVRDEKRRNNKTKNI